MVRLKKLGIIFYLFLCAINLYAQNNIVNGKEKNLNRLRKSYENFEENDEKAIPYIKIYLDQAKSKTDFQNIFQAYKDLIFYSKQRDIKLQYADSCVHYSLKSKDPNLISHAYLTRGIVYYFFFKKYQPALDEYLKAYNYSSQIKDNYLKNSIIYHLGIVKSYLGYYESALDLFIKCTAYFEPISKSSVHPNIIFNNQKGYFNSLHQQAICYRNLNNLAKSDSIVEYSLAELPKTNEFALERAYFLKCRGLSEFNKQNYSKAVANLSSALPEFNKINDFTWASVSYFYIGKSFIEINEAEKGIGYLIKVDSIFQKQQFILPEVRKNYEILINYYNQTKNPEKELFFTKQLLKVDEVLSKDFRYLSSKIHKEYEAKELLTIQQELENANSYTFKLLIGSISIIIVLLLILLYRHRKQKEIKKRYLALEQRLISEEKVNSNENSNIEDQIAQKENRTGIPESVIVDLLQKLDKFETRQEFTKKGITQADLSKRFNTNTTYLSQVINEYKGVNFNTYLNTLRINYVTKELYHNPKFLDYTIEGLSNECGMPSRQSFTELFTEINGIRPTAFINKRKEELKERKS